MDYSKAVGLGCNNGSGLQLAGLDARGIKVKSQAGCFKRPKPREIKKNKKPIWPFRRQLGPCWCSGVRMFLGLSQAQLRLISTIDGSSSHTRVNTKEFAGCLSLGSTSCHRSVCQQLLSGFCRSFCRYFLYWR